MFTELYIILVFLGIIASSNPNKILLLGYFFPIVLVFISMTLFVSQYHKYRFSVWLKQNPLEGTAVINVDTKPKKPNEIFIASMVFILSSFLFLVTLLLLDIKLVFSLDLVLIGLFWASIFFNSIKNLRTVSQKYVGKYNKAKALDYKDSTKLFVLSSFGLILTILGVASRENPDVYSFISFNYETLVAIFFLLIIMFELFTNVVSRRETYKKYASW